MATIVSFHAHPDDESISVGGTLARAAARGDRVVLVFATKGECGEYPEGILADGEELGDRRVAEVVASAEALGAHRVEFLGYRDSGMDGEPTNDDPGCFWQADVEEAASRLAAILTEESADVCTIYDDHGVYGHPDHVQVHRVGVRATELAATPHVLEATFNRDHFRRSIEQAEAEGIVLDPDAPEPPADGIDDSFGSSDDEITTIVDVTDWVGQKRASMAAHASQIPADSFFLGMPENQFTVAFGTEWFIRRGAVVSGGDDWLVPPSAQQDG